MAKKNYQRLTSIEEKNRRKVRQREPYIRDADMIICQFNRELQTKIASQRGPMLGRQETTVLLSLPGTTLSGVILKSDLNIASCTGTGWPKSVISHSLCHIPLLKIQGEPPSLFLLAVLPERRLRIGRLMGHSTACTISSVDSGLPLMFINSFFHHHYKFLWPQLSPLLFSVVTRWCDINSDFWRGLSPWLYYSPRATPSVHVHSQMVTPLLTCCTLDTSNPTCPLEAVASS